MADWKLNYERNLLFVFNYITANPVLHSYAYSENLEYMSFYDNLSDENINTLLTIEKGREAFNTVDETGWMIINVAFLFIPTLIKIGVNKIKFKLRHKYYDFIKSDKFTNFLRAHNRHNARYYLTDEEINCLQTLFTKKDFKSEKKVKEKKKEEKKEEPTKTQSTEKVVKFEKPENNKEQK